MLRRGGCFCLHCNELRIKILSMQLRCKRLIYYTRTRYVFKNPHSFFVRIIAYPLTNERTAWEHTGRFRRQKVQEQHITENWTKDDVQISVVSSAVRRISWLSRVCREISGTRPFLFQFSLKVSTIFFVTQHLETEPTRAFSVFKVTAPTSLSLRKFLISKESTWNWGAAQAALLHKELR